MPSTSETSRIVPTPEPTLAELEAVIERGTQTFIEVGEALASVRDRKLYRTAGYTDFGTYCQERWGFGRAQGHRLIRAARVVQELSPFGDTLPATEAVARELAHIGDPDDRSAVWGEAQRCYPEGVTAAHIRSLYDLRASTRFSCPDCGEPSGWEIAHCPDCNRHYRARLARCPHCEGLDGDEDQPSQMPDFRGHTPGITYTPTPTTASEPRVINVQVHKEPAEPRILHVQIRKAYPDPEEERPVKTHTPIPVDRSPVGDDGEDEPPATPAEAWEAFQYLRDGARGSPRGAAIVADERLGCCILRPDEAARLLTAAQRAEFSAFLRKLEDWIAGWHLAVANTKPRLDDGTK